MKKYCILFIAAALAAHLCSAQLGDILKRKAGEGVKQSTQTGAEKAIDKTIDKLFKKKHKNGKAGEESTSTSGDTKPSPAPAEASIKTYTKYDFVPGEQILGLDDFSQDAKGDFPALWTTNASGEVITTDQYPGKWLNVSAQGFYIPKFIKNLPDNFTIEYDVLFIPASTASGPNTAAAGLQLISAPAAKPAFDNLVDRCYFELDPYMNNINVAGFTKNGDKLLENQVKVKSLQRQHSFTYHIAVYRQKTRLRVYLNETKVVDAPTLLAPEVKYNGVRFATSFNNDGSTWLISNVKYATGMPDTRHKLINEGKFSTTGILFNINSAIILANSYGVIKEIATVLKENPTVRIKITGHTDSDGDKSANLDLSQKRAEAVKACLVKEFGIDADRMQTDGKGETQPVATNDTAAGKARNRRVEFTKM